MDTSSQAVIGTPSTATEPAQKRQRWGVKQKRQIVEETLAVGASVARVARAHGVNANQVFYWRKQYRAGRLGNSTGALKLLDINPRVWGWHSLGQRAGVDFPYLLYADQVGQPVEPCRATPGVRWIRLATDVPTAVVEFLHRRLGWRAYGRSLASSDVEAVFSKDDPMPGLVECGLIPYLAFKRGF